MPLKRKPAFVTPFSSQKVINQTTGQTSNEKAQLQTPAGSFIFPVSSSKIGKVQHVTPMTKRKIKQGLSKVIDSFPQGADPESPAWTFLAVSQATTCEDNDEGINRENEEVGSELKRNNDREAHQCPPEDGDVVVDEEEEVYDYVSTPVSEKQERRKKVIVPRGHKKLVAESMKQEVLKTIYKMHQEIMEIQERRKRLALNLHKEVPKQTLKRKLGTLNATLKEKHVQIDVRGPQGEDGVPTEE